jgi:hypothetical protein
MKDDLVFPENYLLLMVQEQIAHAFFNFLTSDFSSRNLKDYLLLLVDSIFLEGKNSSIEL